jgi:pilus assembly protein CpaC
VKLLYIASMKVTYLMSILHKILIGGSAICMMLTLFMHPAQAKQVKHPAQQQLAISQPVRDITALKQTLRALMPSEPIGVERVNRSIALTGNVSSADAAQKAVKVAEEYVGKGEVINFMQIKSGQQVMLRVRVGEIQRTALKQLGVGIITPLAVLTSLEKDGVFRVLAEPNLVAISGESAEFLAGGEFPVPVAQKGDTMSVEYKSFGVKIAFTPLVLAPNRIRLNVEPEVSEISTIGAVSVKGMNIPSVTSRRAKTTVELAPGESFMIAGLIKDNLRNQVTQLPGLGDIPILGALFRSSAFQRNETELVIAVSPYLVDPVAGNDIRLPTDNFHTPSSLENVFLGAIGGRSTTASPSAKGLEGPSGFIAE